MPKCRIYLVRFTSRSRLGLNCVCSYFVMEKLQWYFVLYEGAVKPSPLDRNPTRFLYIQISDLLVLRAYMQWISLNILTNVCADMLGQAKVQRIFRILFSLLPSLERASPPSTRDLLAKCRLQHQHKKFILKLAKSTGSIIQVKLDWTSGCQQRPFLWSSLLTVTVSPGQNRPG